MSIEGDGAPGERPPAARLERAPGERYVAGPGAGEQPARRIGRGLLLAAAITVVGGLVVGGLELVDFGAGLLAVAVTLGWAIALAIRWTAFAPDRIVLEPNRRALLAAVLAGAAIALGYLVVWVVEGSLIGPLDYAMERFGLLPPVLLLLAVGTAALRAH
jgi:hypothetical protein